MRLWFYYPLCVIICVAAGHASAQEAFRTAFNLPSQSLGDALRAVGTQLDINLLFDPRGVEQQQASAIKTVGTVDDAFALLLAGSGFMHQHLNAHTIVLLSTGRLPKTTPAEYTPISWLRVIERGRPVNPKERWRPLVLQARAVGYAEVVRDH